MLTCSLFSLSTDDWLKSLRSVFISLSSSSSAFPSRQRFISSLIAYQSGSSHSSPISIAHHTSRDRDYKFVQLARSLLSASLTISRILLAGFQAANETDNLSIIQRAEEEQVRFQASSSRRFSPIFCFQRHFTIKREDFNVSINLINLHEDCLIERNREKYRKIRLIVQEETIQ